MCQLCNGGEVEKGGFQKMTISELESSIQILKEQLQRTMKRNLRERLQAVLDRQVGLLEMARAREEA
jgi:hypothetical protein